MSDINKQINEMADKQKQISFEDQEQIPSSEIDLAPDSLSNSSFSVVSSKWFRIYKIVSKSHSEKLDRLIELQEKQLYWIRIIGIPFLFAAIGGFLAILFR